MKTETEFEPFGEEWEKEMMKSNKRFLISQIKHEWLANSRLPLGEQKAPVLIGKLKDSKNIIIQCGGKFVEIPLEMARDVALGIVLAKHKDSAVTAPHS